MGQIAEISNTFLCKHPLMNEKVAQLRNIKTDTKRFRELIKECGSLLGYEATSDLNLREVSDCQGQFSTFTGYSLSEKIALVPILRAGLGLVDSFIDMLPFASVFHLGIYREKVSLNPVEYYNKLSTNNVCDVAFLLDPMIATGGTVIAAIEILKEWGVKKIKLITLCTSSQGLASIVKAHPDIIIHVGVVDDKLSPDGYIIPGFGDAGDRLFNTQINTSS